MQHLTATLKAMFCLVTLAGLGMAPCTAADQALSEGPWFNAKPGSTGGKLNPRTAIQMTQRWSGPYFAESYRAGSLPSQWIPSNGLKCWM